MSNDPEWDLQELRDARSMFLRDTDWVVTKATENDEPIPQAWKDYRQALRDITDTYSSLDDVVWPTKPS